MPTRVSRRFLIRSAGVTCVGMAGSVLLAACSKKDEKAKELSCNDTGSLAPADAELRTNLKYVDRTADPSKVCSNCMQYVAAASPAQCGGCKLLKGTIHPNGYCLSWSARTA